MEDENPELDAIDAEQLSLDLEIELYEDNPFTSRSYTRTRLLHRRLVELMALTEASDAARAASVEIFSVYRRRHPRTPGGSPEPELPSPGEVR